VTRAPKTPTSDMRIRLRVAVLPNVPSAGVRVFRLDRRHGQAPCPNSGQPHMSSSGILMVMLFVPIVPSFHSKEWSGTNGWNDMGWRPTIVPLEQRRKHGVALFLAFVQNGGTFQYGLCMAVPRLERFWSGQFLLCHMCLGLFFPLAGERPAIACFIG